MWAKPTLYKFLPMVEPVSKSCQARSVGGSYADSTKFHLDGAIVADAMIDFAYGEIPTRTVASFTCMESCGRLPCCSQKIMKGGIANGNLSLFH